MFKKKKKDKKKYSSVEYYLCAGVIFVQVILMIWDIIEYKKQEEKQVNLK